MKGRKKSTVEGAAWMVELHGFTFHIYGKSGAWTAVEEITGVTMTDAQRTIELAVMAAKALAEQADALIPTVKELRKKAGIAAPLPQPVAQAARHGLTAVAAVLFGLAIMLQPLAYISNAFDPVVEIEG